MIRAIMTSVAWVSVVFLVVLLSSTHDAEAQSSSCRPPDAISDETGALLKRYVTSSDSFDVKMRNALGIAGTQAKKISYSTNAGTCSSAVTALNALENTPGRARQVYVWNVGTNFAVWDPANQLSQGYRAITLFTSKWAFKSNWAPN